MKRSRTYSRQIATILFLFLGYLAYNDKIEALKALTLPFTTFALFAFGFKQPVVSDWVQRSGRSEVPDGRGSERSGQYSGREDEHSNSRDQQGPIP